MKNKVVPSEAVIEADLKVCREITEYLTKLNKSDRTYRSAIDELRIRACGAQVVGKYAQVSPEAADAVLMELKVDIESPDSRREIRGVLQSPDDSVFMGDPEGRHVPLHEAWLDPVIASELSELRRRGQL